MSIIITGIKDIKLISSPTHIVIHCVLEIAMIVPMAIVRMNMGEDGFGVGLRFNLPYIKSVMLEQSF